MVNEPEPKLLRASNLHRVQEILKLPKGGKEQELFEGLSEWPQVSQILSRRLCVSEVLVG